VAVKTDALNSLVSGAIWRAEQLQEGGLASAAQAWAEVSELEEKLAASLPPSGSESRIARRGAVRAALKAGDFARAQALAEVFGKGAPRALKSAQREMLDEEARQVAILFPHAAKQHSIRDVQELARHFQQAGAFGLAA